MSLFFWDFQIFNLIVFSCLKLFLLAYVEISSLSSRALTLYAVFPDNIFRNPRIFFQINFIIFVLQVTSFKRSVCIKVTGKAAAKLSSKKEAQSPLISRRMEHIAAKIKKIH
jgi:hypothetical protein